MRKLTTNEELTAGAITGLLTGTYQFVKVNLI